MSRKQIVILGGGTGGTMTANRLRRRLGLDEAEIHVVDQDNRHVYQPGLLFVPFGLADTDEIVRPRRRQLRSGIVFHEDEVVAVWPERDEVLLADGGVLPYDVLVVATGVGLQPEETAGSRRRRAGTSPCSPSTRRRAPRRSASRSRTSTAGVWS